MAQLARLTHDRTRDLPAALRERAASALARVQGNETWVRLVREGGELQRGRLQGACSASPCPPVCVSASDGR